MRWKSLLTCAYCDSGDNACHDVPWDQPVNEAKISPAIERPLETTTTKRELQFSLSSAEIADNVVLDPDAVTDAPFLIEIELSGAENLVLAGTRPFHVCSNARACRSPVRNNGNAGEPRRRKY